ncbi:hypothetical protein Cni_G20345 [Canna indica]|uniref:AB hydrolase-1 domain-containing protein n=1 Tax=Canna indica TaxID=4628 RepID=A0AAQ3QJH5_9LILI|nr:hypothetical protein Cni_G20345 [Canna indica]
MGFNLVSLIDRFVRRAYTAARLRPHTVVIDADTTIHCWISSSLLPPPSCSGDVVIDEEEKNKPPAKLPLLLIHGFGPRGTWQWRKQVGVLAAHFDLIVPDLLFFGGSTTRSSQRSEAFQAAALVGLLDALGVAPPLRARVSVAGTSYGGMVAYNVARAMGPERVDRVVIASSDLLKGPEDDRALLERAGGAGSIDEILLPRTTSDVRRLIRLVVHSPPRYVPEFFLRDISRNLFSDNLKEKLELIEGIILSNKEKFQLTPLAQQVLIIWGEHDQIFPLEKAFQIQKRLGEKNAKLEVVEKSGHLPQMENADKFNKVLLDFLLLDAQKTSQ